MSQGTSEARCVDLLVCFKCGANKPGTKRWRKSHYDCPNLSCTGRAIPVSKSLIPVVSKLTALGYYVTGAADSMTLIDNSRLEITLVHIELGKQYDPRCFDGLPPEWFYHTYPNSNTSRLVLSEHYPTYGEIPPKTALNSVIRGLYKYVNELEHRHAPDIFRLAGWM